MANWTPSASLWGIRVLLRRAADWRSPCTDTQKWGIWLFIKNSASERQFLGNFSRVVSYPLFWFTGKSSIKMWGSVHSSPSFSVFFPLDDKGVTSEVTRVTRHLRWLSRKGLDASCGRSRRLVEKTPFRRESYHGIPGVSYMGMGQNLVPLIINVLLGF